MQWVKITNNELDFRVSNLIKCTLLDAAKLAIESIIKNYPPPYHLMVSGGIDSQAMLYLWHKFGSDYIPISFIYNDSLNSHDLETLKIFSSKYNIEIKYLNFDLLNFLLKEYDQFSKKYRCSSPCISAYIKMSETLPGTVIFSGNFLHQNGAVFSDAILGLFRASLDRITLIPYFFLHTPELAYSILQSSLDTIKFNSLNDYEKKVFSYQENGLPVIPQTQKFSGFEKVKDYYDKNFYHLVDVKKKLKFSTKQSNRTFDFLLRYPYEELYNDQKIIYYINKIDGK